MKLSFDSTLPRAGDRVLRGPVAIILGIGIVISVAIAQTIQAIEFRREATDFQLAAGQTIDAIGDRVDSQLDLIRSIVSLFSSATHVDRGEFQAFVADSLGRHPSIQLVGWAPRVVVAQRTAFETAARREGLTNYEINERSADRRVVRAPDRAEYFPNFYLEPPPSTPGTYGLDQASEPVRRAALNLARDSGELVLSERIDLALVTENRTAILAYAPIYKNIRRPISVEQRRELLIGYAYGVVRPTAIVDVMLDDQKHLSDSGRRPKMTIDVYDTTDPSSARHLFNYPDGRSDRVQKSDDKIVTDRNDFVRTLKYGGREWTFVSRPGSGVLTGSIAWQTGLAFAASMCLSLLLAAYLHMVLNRARSIEDEVSLRTNELRLTNELLRHSEDRIRVITDSVPALIAYVDRDLVYRFVNRRYADMGMDPEKMIGTSLSDQRHDGTFEIVKPYFERAARGKAVSFEITPINAAGEKQYRSITCTPDIADDGTVRGFYILGRDITAERTAENAIKQANELLRTSEERLRVITDSVPALIAYVDRNLVYRFANKRYREIGVDPDTLVGKSLADVRRGQAFETIKPYFERAAKGEHVSFEVVTTGEGGTNKYSAIDCTPDVRDGIPRGFYILGRDITTERNSENEIKRAYDLLRSSEERLRVITNALPALIAHVGLDMTIDYANERFSTITVGVEDFVGKQLETALGPERFETVRVACQRALHGEASQLEFGAVTRDGREISILSDFTPDIAGDGSTRGFYFVALNVTAQRALEIELDRFFRQSLSFMCVATYDGFLRRFNETWTSALGYTHDEIVTTPYINFIHPDDRPKVETALERLRTEGDLTNLEIRFLRKDGAERVVLWNAAANRHERQIYATGHDITELKEIDRMKDEFVSTVSHELRTPLTSIKGALGLMRIKTLGTLPADMNTMLDIAYKNCDRLVLLINDILDIEKIEAGKMDFNFAPVDIVSIVRNAMAANQAYADQFGVKLRLESDIDSATARADEGRLMQVMANLLSNAAKFSPENGDVRIAVQRQGHMIRISVSDQGPGIPENFRSRIFEKFSQSDSSDQRKVSGTGLGLSIVRAIIERHGGRIDFDSEIGKGSTFYFDIPEMIINVASDGDTQRPRILVCEDDPDIANILAGLVENCGYSADIAHSADAARSLLARHRYSGMTLDIVLPDVDGIQFFKELRSELRTRFLPVIVVSARATESAAEINGSAVNIVDWLDKPIDNERLANALRSAITLNAHSGPRILHIEDDQDIVQIVARQGGNAAAFVSAGSMAAAREHLAHEHFDLVILDLLLPDGRGEDLLPLMNNPNGSPIPVIIFSAVEVPIEVAHRVEAALVKTKSTDAMLREAIDALVAHHTMTPSTSADVAQN